MFQKIAIINPKSLKSFGAAVDAAQKALSEGKISKYSIQSSPIEGRIIKIENSKGWSPYPLWVEFPQMVH